MPILQPIKPQYCELIVAGKKTIEVRKTRPKIKTPFKDYIYCTKNGFYGLQSKSNPALKKNASGKVIGEYVCDEIVSFGFTPYNHGEYVVSFDEKGERDILKESCLTFDEMYDYIGEGHGYGWHISDLVIYDKPKELSGFMVIDKRLLKVCPYRFRAYNNPDYTNGAWLPGSYTCNYNLDYEFYCHGQCEMVKKPLTRPPQSWCYVEEV